MATLVGTASGDTLRGTRDADDLAGLDGDDVIDGRLGGDQIDGGQGDDRLEGGPDNDLLLGGPGDDDLIGGTHDDTLYGGIGDDRLQAGQGFDSLNGGAGDDRLFGGAGFAALMGEDGNDILVAGSGGSSLDGGPGDDTMTGGIGSDGFQSREDDADTFMILAEDGNFGFDNIFGFNGEGEPGGDTLRLAGSGATDFTITEHFGFSGPILFDRPVTEEDAEASTETQVAVEPTATDGSTGQPADVFTGGLVPSNTYTTFSSDFGTIQVDAVGLQAGVDYIFV